MLLEKHFGPIHEPMSRSTGYYAATNWSGLDKWSDDRWKRAQIRYYNGGIGREIEKKLQEVAALLNQMGAVYVWEEDTDRH